MLLQMSLKMLSAGMLFMPHCIFRNLVTCSEPRPFKGNGLPQKVLQDLQDAAYKAVSVYATLRVVSELGWKLTPKFHLLRHLTEETASWWGNPRHFWCYRDEDMMKATKAFVDAGVAFAQAYVAFQAKGGHDLDQLTSKSIGKGIGLSVMLEALFPKKDD